MVNKRFYDSIRLSYSKTEIVDRVDQIEHSIFREALRWAQIEKQVEIVSVSDVPAQCGLGTSSVFTVALLNALCAYKKDYFDLEKLARSANHLEMNLLKQPVGKQDHYAAAFGGFKAYWFNQDGSVTIEPVKIREEKMVELQNNLLLFHVKKERPASVVLKTQNQNSLEGDTATLERLHKIKEMGFRTKKIFEEGNLDDFGAVLHEHWLIKKGFSPMISDPVIDEIYDVARKNGAIGGKIVGAGGGGFMLLYCAGGKSKIVAALEKMGLTPTWFSFEHEGAEIVFHSQ